MMHIDNIIPHKWSVWMARPEDMYEELHRSDIFKKYFGTFRSIERRAKRDLPDGYEIIEINKIIKPKKKRRSPLILIQCIYRPCMWLIYNKKETVNRLRTDSLIDVIKYMLHERILFARIKLWADFKEMADPDWLPF